MRERLLFLGFFVVLLTVAVRHNVPEISTWNYHFGGEYGNIAESLAAGKGYSNPFEDRGVPLDTGPTAWMPPVYTYLLALLFEVLGPRTSIAVWALLVIKVLALTVIPVLLFRICFGTSRGNWPFLIIPIYAFLLRYSFDAFFLMTHDIWLVALLITLLLYSYHRHVQTGRPFGVGWSILGGLAVLVNPALGPGYVLLTLLPNTPTTWRRKMAVLAIAFAATSPWLIRNYLVFDRLIPVKSNLFFDLYQSNYLDDDGILTKLTFERFHPHNNSAALREYASLGETGFMDRYRADFFRDLRAQPGVFVRKIFNRCIAAFLVFPIFETPGELWGWTGKVKAITYAFPFVFSIFLLWQRRRRQLPIVDATLLLFYFFLLPYLIVGFYGRYRVPMISILTLLYFYTAVFILEEVTPQRVVAGSGAAYRWFKNNLLMNGREP